MNDRKLVFADFAAMRGELDRLHSAGYKKTGQWDLSQICDHLNYFMTDSLDGHQFQVPWIFKALFGRMVLRRILNGGTMKKGVFSPQKPLPSPGGDEAAAIARLKATTNRIDAHRGEFLDSPFFGHLTPDGGDCT